jgi:hypothetical protein
MSNVLSEEKKQQVIALGKLGWPLRRIEQATGVRRETAGAYLKAAGIGVRAPGGWGRRGPAKPANEVTTDFGPPISLPTGNRDRVTSACEPYRELLEAGTRSWSECHGHLAGPGFRSRLSQWLPDREAFCSQASRFCTTPSLFQFSVLVFDCQPSAFRPSALCASASVLCFTKIPCALKMVRFTAAMFASSRSPLHPRTPGFCPGEPERYTDI